MTLPIIGPDLGIHQLTHWGWDKISYISQTTFWNAFSLMKMYEFISLKFVQINNIPALVKIMVWHRPGYKPLSGPMIASLLTYISVTWPQWVKTQQSESLPNSNALQFKHLSLISLSHEDFVHMFVWTSLSFLTKHKQVRHDKVGMQMIHIPHIM